MKRFTVIVMAAILLLGAVVSCKKEGGRTEVFFSPRELYFGLEGGSRTASTKNKYMWPEVAAHRIINGVESAQDDVENLMVKMTSYTDYEFNVTASSEPREWIVRFTSLGNLASVKVHQR